MNKIVRQFALASATASDRRPPRSKQGARPVNKLLTNLLTKTGTKFVFASALLVAIGAVSLSRINTAQAQSPSINIERLDNYNLKITWENISTDDGNFNFFVDESGVITKFLTSTLTSNSFVFFAESNLAATRDQFTRVNNADRIGVAGNDGANDRAGLQWVDVPNPTLIVERLADNSIRLTWNNIYTKGTQYGIPIIESGARNLVGLFTTAETLNIPDDHAQFSRVNGAQQICVIGTDDAGIILSGDALCKRVPAELSGPSLTVERLADNSLKLSWGNIRTNELAKSFQIFVITGTTETRINAAIFFDVNEAVIDSDYFAFNQINNAEQVGIAGTRSDGSGGIEYLDKTFQPVPARKLPSVDFERQANGDISISWENIPSTGGNNAIWITTGGVNTEIIPNVAGGSPYLAPTGSFYYDRISNAQRVGVSDRDVGVDAVTFADIPSADANLSSLTIDPGTLLPNFAADTLAYTASVANDVASVTLTPTTADAGATVNVDGAAVTSGAASAAINLNVGANALDIIVTAADATTKTYTVTVTRAAVGISDLDGKSGVSIKDAKFLYYAHALDLTPEDSTALATLTSAGEGELGGLLTAAKGLVFDLNGDGATDAEDAAVLYYSFALEGSLGNGGSKPGLPDIKRAILGPLAVTNDMAAINTMLQEAHRARGL